jgi:hypothetical protein
LIELDVEGAKPGDDLPTEASTLKAHVRLRAAPWVDVSQLEVVVGGKSIDTIAIPSRPTAIGPELGTREEVEARTIRFDADLTIPVGPESSWVVVIARGARKMDDVLPFMPVPPLAFTNPVFVVRPTP